MCLLPMKEKKGKTNNCRIWLQIQNYTALEVTSIQVVNELELTLFSAVSISSRTFLNLS